MSWKEISHEDGHVLVEYANGSKLNIRYDHLIEMSDPDRVVPQSPVGAGSGLSVKAIATQYTFAKGAVLSEHTHEEATTHDVVVAKGMVVVHLPDRNVDAYLSAGERLVIKPGERHSIEALEDSVTVHTLVNH
jgi:quercetin dioxygenase-like cupin family protein